MRRTVWRAAVLLALMFSSSAGDGVSAQQSAATGSLAGVVHDEAGTPVRLAIVTIRSDAPTITRSVITDDEGRFSFAGLPAGRFGLTGEKAAHIENHFGSVRPGRPGTPVALGPGEGKRDIVLELPRGGVITGVVRDPQGRTAAGLTITATPVRGGPLLRRGGVAHEIHTDDQGRYRLFGLMPGEYFVSAHSRITATGGLARLSSREIDAIFAAAEQGRQPPATADGTPMGQESAEQVVAVPTYYPGSPRRGSSGV